MGRLFGGGGAIKKAVAAARSGDYRVTGRPGASSLYTGRNPGGAPANEEEERRNRRQRGGKRGTDRQLGGPRTPLAAA